MLQPLHGVINMATVKLSDSLVDQAKIVALAQHRSVPKQIEYWALLGRAAKENPDLPIELIESVLESLEEIKAGAALTEFKFSE
jgi:hypothetical protein